MKNIDKIMAGKEILVGLMVLICIGNVAAFAISSDYWSQYPLRMAPGETKEFSLILQNLVGTSDLKLKAVVSTGSSVLRLADSSDIYIVPAGEKKNVDLIASVPADSKPGQIYNVKVDFSEITDSSSGEFRLGTAIGQGFDIVILPGVVEELNKNLILYIAAGAILLAVIIFILLRILKKKSKKKRR